MSEIIKLTEEQNNTIRFQLIFGLGSLCVALAIFWVGSTFNIIDLRFGFLFLCVVIAAKWLLDGFTMLADVFIVIMKWKGIK
jgi:hypothetical protein